jgi:ribonuclease P protein component
MDARPEQGFPPSCRLRTSREYSQLWRQGRRCHTAQLLVIAAPGSEGCRLGISVGRKVGNAVCRNRIKRWLREYFRRYRVMFDAGTDLSIVVKPGAAQLGHAEFDQQLQEALRRLRVYEDI